MSNLHRTQIYIDKEQIHQLKIEAEKERLPVSVVIREAIRRHLETRIKSVDWDSDPLTKAVGKVKLPVDDASVNHDDYLYRSRKKK